MKIPITTTFTLLALSQSAYSLSILQPVVEGLKTGLICKRPDSFTSAYFVRAEPGQVIATDNSGPAPGEEGAIGRFAYYLNSDKNVICYDLETDGVTGEYQSAAVTATHIHQAVKGINGPPRIAFPNPQKTGTRNGKEIRKATGCLEGPFRTGVNVANTTTDSGSASGFTLKDIERNATAFFGDTHTAAFVPGAVRGQLTSSERQVKAPKQFTSILRAKATSDVVVNANNTIAAGKEGGRGTYELKLNVDEDILCYSITTYDVGGEYFSPAKTATHIHEAVAGANGPPRIAFQNPIQSKLGKAINSRKRFSSDCIKGPFSTGLNNATTGIDTGSASGFTLKKLQENPGSFFVDTHTFDFQAGAIRGQLERVK